MFQLSGWPGGSAAFRSGKNHRWPFYGFGVIAIFGNDRQATWHDLQDNQAAQSLCLGLSGYLPSIPSVEVPEEPTHSRAAMVSLKLDNQRLRRPNLWYTGKRSCWAILVSTMTARGGGGGGGDGLVYHWRYGVGSIAPAVETRGSFPQVRGAAGGSWCQVAVVVL